MVKAFKSGKNQLILWSVVAVIGFQNCSQSPFGKMGFQIDDSVSLDSGGENIVSNPVALMTGDQLLKSMMSTTGVDPNQTILNEFNRSSSSYAGGYDLKQKTSVMAMNATNLASFFCDESMNQANSRDKFYQGIDLATSIEGADGSKRLSDEQYLQVVEKMGRSFWGRSPSSEETDIIHQAMNEFVSEFTPAERQANTSIRRLMLFTCTAMLVSFDAISF
jgi:hypothetical protein